MKRSIALMTAMLLASCGGQGGEENQQAGPAEAGNQAPAPAAATGGDVQIQPGMWETNVEVVSMTVPNMPQGVTLPKQAAVTDRSCLTPAQVSSAGPNFFSGNKNANCTSQNFSMAGGRLQGTMQCDVAGTQMAMTMDGQFTPTSYEVTQHIEMTVSGMETEQEVRVTSRRVGDCPA